MKISYFLSSIIFALCMAPLLPASSFAATDGVYFLEETAAIWDGTDATLMTTPTAVYDHTYGDESSLVYNLPWPFVFYGQTYNRITVDTNGNIWFGSSNSAHSFTLAHSGRGPVISVWNNDLSSYFHGGVFVQSKNNPERIVVEWKAESYADEGLHWPASFETVLYRNGIIRFDYGSFFTENVKDFGSGISSDDGVHYMGITANYGNVFTLAGRSFQFTEISQVPSNTVSVFFSGTGSGIITSTPPGVACTTGCATPFRAGTEISLHSDSSPYSIFTGWTNGACSGAADCRLTLNGDTTVTAVFEHDTSHQVRIDGASSEYYSSIQAAYDVIADSTTIKLWAIPYFESLACNRPLVVILKGGYDRVYNSIVDNAILNGTLTISDGKVAADGLEIR
jgi:hypothetical protein